MIMCGKIKFVFITIICNIWTQQIVAGLLLSPSIGLGIFSFRPMQVEETPNYYGVGPALDFGYSLQQVIDLAGFIKYIPGSASSAHIGKENASLVLYGGQLSGRIDDKVFISFKGGMGQYHLVRAANVSEEVFGRWEGPGGGLMLGAIFKIKKRVYWQVGLEIMHWQMQRKNEAKKIEDNRVIRKIDYLCLVAAYTFNGFSNHFGSKSIFGSLF